MPDRRRHRGKHPEDARLFAESHHASLRMAVSEYSWLLTREYAEESALKLIGDHHGLTVRRRQPVMRSACPNPPGHSPGGPSLKKADTGSRTLNLSFTKAVLYH